MYAATTQHLNYSGQKSKKAHFAVYISDTPVILKQNQGHETYNENVDPKQGYNHAKFARSCNNTVRENGNVIFFSKQGNM